MLSCAEWDFNCARSTYDVCYESGGQEFFLAQLTSYDKTSISQKFMDNTHGKMTSQLFRNNLTETKKQVEFCGLMNYGKAFENATFSS